MKIGFTIGKFAPLHKGHEMLIKKGVNENDEFYILINDTDIINIPLKQRAEWIKKMFPTTRVILGENPPKQFGMDENSIKIQTDYLLEMFKGIPVTTFYSCEEYGKYVAKAFNGKFVKLEKYIPISATKIRGNIEENKEYLEKNIYEDLINFEK